MLLWISIALLTAAAVMAVLVPLGRAPKAREGAEKASRVYLDQLEELKRDQAQGRISAPEAESARAEIARRLIAADEAVHQSPVAETGSQSMRRATALVGLLGIPILSLTLYLALGAPGLPGQPLAARLAAPPSPSDVEALVVKVEEHLGRAPEDGRGWDVIAPVYLRLGRTEDAQRAYRNAIRLLGATASRQSGLGEAILAAQGGVVTADAREAFEAALKIAPGAPAPRFFLALALEQEGKSDEAVAGWRNLLAEAPPDAPWRAAVEDALARVTPAKGPGGPTAAQVAAAQDAPPDEQAAMVEGMVGRLADRLRREPDDVEGWLRLIRSYVVLGRSQEAEAAAGAALQGVVKGEDRQRVEALIADLEITAGASAQ